MNQPIAIGRFPDALPFTLQLDGVCKVTLDVVGGSDLFNELVASSDVTPGLCRAVGRLFLRLLLSRARSEDEIFTLLEWLPNSTTERCPVNLDLRDRSSPVRSDDGFGDLRVVKASFGSRQVECAIRVRKSGSAVLSSEDPMDVLQTERSDFEAYVCAEIADTCLTVIAPTDDERRAIVAPIVAEQIDYIKMS